MEASPGDWATLIWTLPFSKARARDYSIKTLLRQSLYEEFPRRELMNTNSSFAQP